MAGPPLPYRGLGVLGSGLLQNTPPRGWRGDVANGDDSNLGAGAGAVGDGGGEAGGGEAGCGGGGGGGGCGGGGGGGSRGGGGGGDEAGDAAGDAVGDGVGDVAAGPARVGAFFIGVTGASASGKTTVCRKIMDGLADRRCALVCVDWFYHGLAEGADAADYNFDHPDAFDFAALRDTLKVMAAGVPVSVARYDFTRHRRDPGNASMIGAADVVIVEGILTFYDPQIREMMNLKVFVDEDADVCLARRIRRDAAERGRSVDSVLSQYERFVKPSFENFILPTKRYADIVLPRGKENLVAVDLIVKHCALKIQQVDLRKVLPNLVVMADSYQARGLHTLFRDASATRHDFVFYADRLMRLLIEEGLGLLPFERKCVTTPQSALYYGVGFSAGLCGVSLMPGGEAMENALRLVAHNIRIGKMLIAAPSRERRSVVFAKLPSDVSQRHILLLEPVLNTGLSCITAIEHLLTAEVGCREEHILVLSVVASRLAATELCRRFPKSRLVVSAVDNEVDANGDVVPGLGDFATRYFGTD